MKDYESSHLPGIYVPYSLQTYGFIASAAQAEEEEEEKAEEEIKGYQTNPFPQSSDVFFFTGRRTLSHPWSLCKCTTGEDHMSMELVFYSRGIAYVLLWSPSLSETPCLPNPLLSSEHSRLVEVVRVWYDGHWRYSSSSFAFLPVLRG